MSSDDVILQYYKKNISRLKKSQNRNEIRLIGSILTSIRIRLALKNHDTCICDGPSHRRNRVRIGDFVAVQVGSDYVAR